jgi:hypothetical protein
MSSVKSGASNTEERLIVVPYRPGQRRAQYAVGAVVLGLVCLGAYLFGRYHAQLSFQQLDEQRQALFAERARLQERVALLGQKLADAEISSQVDSDSVVIVREALLALEQDLADQRQELTFYKGMMAPSELEKGLTIGDWDVTKQEGTSRYDFRLVMQQLAAVHRVIKGRVSISIEGIRNGDLVRVPISELSPQMGNASLKLRFKYFQNIEGELELPDDFEPRSVVVDARSFGKKPEQRQKTFDWLEH